MSLENKRFVPLDGKHAMKSFPLQTAFLAGRDAAPRGEPTRLCRVGGEETRLGCDSQACALAGCTIDQVCAQFDEASEAARLENRLLFERNPALSAKFLCFFERNNSRTTNQQAMTVF